MVGAFGSQTSHHKQTYWFSVAWEIQKATQRERSGQLECLEKGLNMFKWAYVHKHIHITHAHTLSQRWETDATLFFASLISNPPTPNKMSHFLWETHKQLFPSHMTQAAKAICVANAGVDLWITVCPLCELCPFREIMGFKTFCSLKLWFPAQIVSLPFISFASF